MEKLGQDPAVLFYTKDFLAGTFTMSNEHKGMYITLLCLQHQNGKLTDKDMQTICGGYVEEVFSKFVKQDDGTYVNARMKEEAIKRASFTSSRRANAKKGGRPPKSEPNAKPNAKPNDEHMDNHMGNANEDVNGDVNGDADICESFKNPYSFDETITLPIVLDKSGRKITLLSFNLEQRYNNLRKANLVKEHFEYAVYVVRDKISGIQFNDQSHYENWFAKLAPNESKITGKVKVVV